MEKGSRLFMAGDPRDWHAGKIGASFLFKYCREAIIPNLHVSLIFHCVVICMHCVC